MEIIKNIAATEAKTWETLATAIDNNFSEQQQNINDKQPKGNYALKSEIPDISQFVTKDEIGNLNAILDNINGEVV